MSHVLALDQGTTSCRAIVFDSEGTIRGLGQNEFGQIFPRPGWVEHDPEEIWTVQLDVAQRALSAAGLDARSIDAVGITNQRETTVLWERATGKPIHHAIVWQDRRTAAHCDRLRAEGRSELFREKTGLVLDPYFSGTKLSWLLDHIDGARERAAAGELAFGTIDSWLVWKMTSGRSHVTDVSNASRTLLYDIRRGCWDLEILQLLDIPPELLPEVRPSSEVYAETDEDFIGTPVPIAGMAGDQQAALFGQVCTRPGMAKNTYGTGCFLLMNTGETPVASRHELLTTVAWQLGRHPMQYALEGSVFIAGAAVQWLRDGLGIIADAGEMAALAGSVSDNGGIYFVPAFAGLGAPHWDAYARGTIVGLSRGTTRGHLARATLEAIAHQSADVMEANENDSGLRLTELRVDGGAAANDLLLQIQSDLLGVPVLRPKQLETTALGAAYLAGLAVGVWKDVETISSHWQVERTFEPSAPDGWAESERERWKRAVERSRDWHEE